MMIPTKIIDRLTTGVKKYKPILKKAYDKDINESDTVTIIVDMLENIFGYDKFTDITSEYAIKKTFCDLAIKLDNKLSLLIEVKAIGLELNNNHIKQAVDYGANEGVEWVILTNGRHWKVFKIYFAKPIRNELVYEFKIDELNMKKPADVELIYYISKESVSRPKNDSLSTFANQKQFLNSVFISNLLVTDTVIDTIRKYLKRIEPSTKATNEDIRDILVNSIIKRDVLEDEKNLEAKKRIKKFENAKTKEKGSSKLQSE